jgi:hypothetical protein
MLAAAEAGTEESPPDEPQAEAETPEQPAGVLQTRFGGDVHQLERSYQELEQHLGRQGNELGKKVQALEAELNRRNEPEPEPEYAYDEDSSQWPDMSYDQFQEWMETDTAGASTYLVNKAVELSSAQIRAELQKEMDERIKPIASHVETEAANSVASGLKKTFGADVVQRNQELLAAEVERQPGLLRGDAKEIYQNMKRIIATAEWERGNAPQNGNGQPAPEPVHIEGGSQGRPVDAAGEQDLTPGEQLFHELTSTRIERDAFGNPKRPQ